MKFKLLSILILNFIFTPMFIPSHANEVQVVSHVDLDRYMGTWYEIASFPQWFQKGCTATQADYRLKSDGDIEVINKCRVGDINGREKSTKGNAWIPNETEPGKLKVQFFLSWLRIPLFAGDYWIVMLDDVDYSYSVISGPKRDTLWILSRTKEMDSEKYLQITEELKLRGYDLTKLVKTIQ